jgi:hypothetical protein
MAESNGFSDYESLASYGGTIHAMWTDNRGATSTMRSTSSRRCSTLVGLSSYLATSTVK